MQETISVECPHCGEKFVMVEPESGQNEDVEEQEPELEHPMIKSKEITVIPRIL